MKIIERYLLKSFLGPFLWCIVVFIFLYVIIDLFENLDEILRNSTPINILIQYYINSIPDILIKVTPLSVLLSLIYTLSKFNKKNEVTTMRASGISLFEIFKPFLIIGIFISILILLINLNLVPIANKKAEKLKVQYLKTKKIKKLDKVVKNVTLYGYNNKIIYAKSFNPKINTLFEIILLKQYKNGIIQRTTAEKAIWEEGDWKLIESITYFMKSNGAIVGNPKFSREEVVTLQEKPEDFLRDYTEAKFMKYVELKQQVDKFRGVSNKIIRRILIELYTKISLPFISIIMVLIAVPFALNINYTGTFMSVGICVGIGFSYYAINAISLALGNAGILPPFISAWLTNIIFTIIGITLLVIKD